jgi:hypothetical protein
LLRYLKKIFYNSVAELRFTYMTGLRNVVFFFISY